MNNTWTEAERDYLRENAGRLTDLQISAELSRITGRIFTLNSVRKQRQKLKIQKKHGRGVCQVVKPDRGLPLRITGTKTHE